MRTLRVVNGLLGVLVVVAAATGSRPEVFRFLLPAGVLLFVIGCGCVAGDAVPFHPVPLLCSVGGAALGLVLIARGGPAELLGAAVVVLQAVAWRASPSAPGVLGAPPDRPRPQRARVQ